MSRNTRRTVARFARPARLAAAIAIAAFAAIAAPAARAAGDLTRQEPIEIRVQLGSAKGEMLFSPNELGFETGKLYKLVLTNPGPVAHYFTSPTLSGAVFTRKVQINGPDGKAIGEVKGNIAELEVYPGGTVEWWFVPVKAASGELSCTIAGHAEHGMVGKVSIK